MVDGETSVMMVIKISSIPRPGRVPKRSFWFRIAVSGGGGASEVYLGKTPKPHSFQDRGYM
jgi:hypothetical protein